MLRQYLPFRGKFLQRAVYTAFGTSSAHHAQQTEHPAKVTKFNPLSQKDLRGFGGLPELNENEASYSPIQSTNHSITSAYAITSWLPNKLAKALGKLVAHPKSAIASDSLYLPRISQGSIPIYDSIDKFSVFSLGNRGMTQVLPLVVLVFSQTPALAALSYGIVSYIYYQLRWKTIQHLVIKAELSPHTEQIIYQKISRLGCLKTSRVKISDLEVTTLDDIYGEENHSQRSIRGLFNREVVFKIKGSQELLFFDRNGIWNEDGINHPLLL